MDAFDFNNFYRCKDCPFLTSDSWNAKLHKKLCHDQLITEKTKNLITTILNAIIDPDTTKNINIGNIYY